MTHHLSKPLVGLFMLLALVACGRHHGHTLDPCTIDSDGDGVVDCRDAFPFDPTETGDNDGDGIGDNADPDDDNDSVLDVDDVDEDGDGLIELYTLAQLDWVRNDLAGTSLTDSSANSDSTGCPTGSGCIGYEQMADWDFDTNGDGVMDANDAYYDYDGDGSNSGWLPIGSGAGGFTGDFDGNGFRIQNLYINRPQGDNETNGEYIGLFGYTEDNAAARDVSIRHIHVDGPLTSITGYRHVGALIGYASYTVAAPVQIMLVDCAVTGRVTAADINAGGLVGGLYFANAQGDLVLNRLQTSGSVSAGNHTAGGLFGLLDTRGVATMAVNDIDSAATVTAVGANSGGLLGALYAYAEDLVISDVHASGSVAGNTSAGGLIGYIWVNNDATANLTAASASGQVSTAASNAGGLIGYMKYGGAVRLKNLRASGAVSGRYGVGGLIGYVYDTGQPTTQFNLSQSYASGNVQATNGTVGGLIGNTEFYDGSYTISAVYATGAVSSGGNLVGGLIGEVYGGNGNGTITIHDVNASGNVTNANSTNTGSSGGLVGGVYIRQGAIITFRNAYATGKITGVRNAGGFIGEVNSDSLGGSLDISNAFATGAVSGGDYVGGFGGRIKDTTIAAAFSSGATTGTRYVGGFLGKAETTTLSASFTTAAVAATQYLGAFVGESVDAVYNHNYYADNGAGPAGIGLLSSGAAPNTADLGGFTLSQLQCPLTANDSGCTGSTLYAGWETYLNSNNDPVWDYGTTAQLPGLNLGGIVFRDANGDGSLD